MTQELGQIRVLAAHRRDVEHHGLAALRLHDAEVLAGHHVARREFGALVDTGHVPFAVFVEQHRALAAYRLGNEEVLAHGHRGGVELVELHVGDLCAGTPCGRQTVRGGDGRIGGVRVETSGATGGEDDA